MYFDAISECPHLDVEEVDAGPIPTVPQIIEPQESDDVTLTIPVPVLATQRLARLYKLVTPLILSSLESCHSSKQICLELWKNRMSF